MSSRQLGLTVPLTLHGRADEVIEYLQESGSGQLPPKACNPACPQPVKPR
jgi:hypothetical protein